MMTEQTWPCSRVFDFKGVLSASCVWVTAAEVHISFPFQNDVSVSSLVLPGDTVTLLPGVLTAACRQSALQQCSYPLNNMSTSAVAAPVNPLPPDVVLRVPNEVGTCQDLAFDASGSIGNLGRPWRSVEWEIEDEVGVSVDWLQTLLNSYSSLDVPIPVSVSDLTINRYTVQLRLTNYLNASSYASTSFQVVQNASEAPQIQFIGSSDRVMYRRQPLSLQSEILVSNCSKSEERSFTWRVYKNFVYVRSLQSESRDPLRMLLSPYRLQVETTYQFQVTVTTSSGQSNTALSEVFVRSAPVRAILSGGSRRSIALNQALTLDASTSVDLDADPLSQSHLRFSWSCRVVSLVFFGSSCDHLLDTDPLDVSSVIHMEAGILSPNSSYELSVVVYSLLDASRSSRASTIVSVLPFQSSIIIDLLPIRSSFSTSSDLIISSQIRGNVSFPVHAVWSIMTGSSGPTSLVNKNNSDLILTMTERNLTVKEVGTVISFPIRISSLLFKQGKEYVFRLTVLPVGVSERYGSYMEVRGVASYPPSAGTLRIRPISGNSSTLFLQSARQWVTDSSNYPLLYGFQYNLTQAGPALTISAPSERPYISSYFPPGVSNSSIFCTLTVTDVLGAYAVTVKQIKVFPDPSLSAITSFSSSLQRAVLSGNADSVMREVNNVAVVASAANCSAAPECVQLNRHPCVDVSHTCGVCLTGYDGVYGAYNGMCSAVSETSRLNIGDSCTVATERDCVFGVCSNGVCIAPMQSCPTNIIGSVCSGNGVCQYRYTANNLIIDSSCTVADTGCRAFCICASGYGGSDCSLSLSELEVLSSARSLMCEAVVNVSSQRDLTPHFLTSQAGALAVAFDPSQLNEAGVMRCSEVLTSVSLMVSGGNLDGASVGILDLVSSILSEFMDWTMQNQHSMTDSVSLMTTLSNSLKSLQTGIQSSMVPGQYPVVTMSANMKMSVHYDIMSSLYNSTLTAGKLSGYRSYSTQIQSHLTLPTTGLDVCGYQGSYAQFSVMESGTNVFTNNSELVSGMFSLSFAKSTVRANLPDSEQNYTLVQQFPIPQSLNSTRTPPQCVDVVNGTVFPCPCELRSFTEYNATFECRDVFNLCGVPADPPITARRLQLRGSQVASQQVHSEYSLGSQGSVNHQYSTLITSVGTSFVSQLTKPVGVDILLQNRTGLSLVGGIGLVVIIGLIYFYHRDMTDRNIVIYVKNSRPADDGDEDVDLSVFSKREKGEIKSKIRKEGIELQRLRTMDSCVSAASTRSIFNARNFLAENVRKFYEAMSDSSTMTSESNPWKRFAKKLFLEHSWTCMFAYPSLRVPRTIRFMIIVSRVMIIMLVNTLFYSSFFPQDVNACNQYSSESEEECLRAPSAWNGGSLCQWRTYTRADGAVLSECNLIPPPNLSSDISGIIFYVQVLLTMAAWAVVPIIIITLLLRNVCAKRPNITVLGLQSRVWFGSDTSPKRRPRQSILGRAVTNSEYVDEEDRMQERLHYAYVDRMTVEEECDEILQSCAEVLHSNMLDAPLPWKHSIKFNEHNAHSEAMKEQLGVDTMGNLVPLTWRQLLIYKSPRQRMESKIRAARRREDVIRQQLKGIGKGEHDTKDILLMQHFFLEQLNPLKRFALKREFLLLHNSTAEEIDVRLWVLGWLAVICFNLFSVYWILNWCATSGSAAFTAWGISIGLDFAQDIFINEVAILYLSHVVVAEVLRPHLKHMYDVLGDVSKNTILGDVSTKYLNAVQHLSGACRIARTKMCEGLGSAHILRSIRDPDISHMRHFSSVPVSLLAILLITMANSVAIFGDTVGEGVMDCFWTCVWSGFLMVNVKLVSISPFLLALPYVSLVIILVVYYLIIKPYRKQRQHASAVDGWSERYEDVSYLSLRSRYKRMKIHGLKLWHYLSRDSRGRETELTAMDMHQMLWRNMNLAVHTQGGYNPKKVLTHWNSTTEDLVIDMRLPSRTYSSMLDEEYRAVVSEVSPSNRPALMRWRRRRVKHLSRRNVYEEDEKVFHEYDFNKKGVWDITDVERFVRGYWVEFSPRYANMDDEEVYELVDYVLVHLDPQNVGVIFCEDFRIWFHTFRRNMLTEYKGKQILTCKSDDESLLDAMSQSLSSETEGVSEEGSSHRSTSKLSPFSESRGLTPKEKSLHASISKLNRRASNGRFFFDLSEMTTDDIYAAREDPSVLPPQRSISPEAINWNRLSPRRMLSCGLRLSMRDIYRSTSNEVNEAYSSDSIGDPEPEKGVPTSPGPKKIPGWLRRKNFQLSDQQRASSEEDELRKTLPSSMHSLPSAWVREYSKGSDKRVFKYWLRTDRQDNHTLSRNNTT